MSWVWPESGKRNLAIGDQDTHQDQKTYLTTRGRQTDPSFFYSLNLFSDSHAVWLLLSKSFIPLSIVASSVNKQHQIGHAWSCFQRCYCKPLMNSTWHACSILLGRSIKLKVHPFGGHLAVFLKKSRAMTAPCTRSQFMENLFSFLIKFSHNSSKISLEALKTASLSNKFPTAIPIKGSFDYSVL